MNQNLWAPWRMAYLQDLQRREGELRADARDGDADCFLSTYWRHPEHDEDNLVIHRDEHGIIMLNRYPYANGHLLVALGEPRQRLLDYPATQRAAFWSLMDLAVDLVETTLGPQGVNIGVNQGAAAGAGVPEHLHGHIVPRWAGDTNFITVVGEVRVVPDALADMAARFRATVAARRNGSA